MSTAAKVVGWIIWAVIVTLLIRTYGVDTLGGMP